VLLRAGSVARGSVGGLWPGRIAAAGALGIAPQGAEDHRSVMAPQFLSWFRNLGNSKAQA